MQMLMSMSVGGQLQAEESEKMGRCQALWSEPDWYSVDYDGCGWATSRLQVLLKSSSNRWPKSVLKSWATTKKLEL